MAEFPCCKFTPYPSSYSSPYPFPHINLNFSVKYEYLSPDEDEDDSLCLLNADKWFGVDVVAHAKDLEEMRECIKDTLWRLMPVESVLEQLTNCAWGIVHEIDPEIIACNDVVDINIRIDIYRHHICIGKDDRAGFIRDTTCSICREDFSDYGRRAWILQPACLHVFHLHCATMWLWKRSYCPICHRHMELPLIDCFH